MCERDSCRFLERRPGVQSLTCCAVGVNFCCVGQARELCGLCPLSDGGWRPTCEFMAVYTFLREEKGQRWIEVRVDCRVLEDEVAGCVREDEIARVGVQHGGIADLRRQSNAERWPVV